MVFVIVCVRYYGSLRISTVIDYGIDVSYLLYKKFVEVVNSQIKFNEPGNINAFPIVGYHKVTKDAEDATSPELFYLEMQYLFDNGFKVITIDDLGYDKYQERFYIKNVDILGSESLEFQDISPTWTETIRTQPVTQP